ncbi:hypothetical protein Lal_00036623 [Lupinus albus]|uniref:Putative transcription factor bHLH family n=1 Tax=Lupinus albus TaxID=3870 RepID=A0A6A4NX54_LUPAL|nr:putative transcription factor bHLH family [Lupinus albus]KAF1892261.1 hypothetical protein Lal_00036623 [Lupinus albus]
MASLQPNFESTNFDTFHESNHKRRCKIEDHGSITHIPWRSETVQRIYTSKLTYHLRHVLRRIPISGREVRVSADRVLAATAKGRTRWSRAILASRLSRWNMKYNKVKKLTKGFVKRKPEIRTRLPVIQKKVRVLSRLVPGCREVSFPNLLEEATDYISALEMQVRVMTALAELLAGGAPPESPP